MMHITIVDQNPFIARQVKYLLEQAGHRVTICTRMDPGSALQQEQTPDLVLIGQRRRDDCGWPCFNRWQRTVPGVALMLYVLDDCQAALMNGLSQAVNQAQVTLARTPRKRGESPPAPTHNAIRPRDVIDVRFRK